MIYRPPADQSKEAITNVVIKNYKNIGLQIFSSLSSLTGTKTFSPFRIRISN